MNTTYMPVMKPDTDALVVWMPSVCSSWPPPYSRPSTTPTRRSCGDRRPTARGNSSGQRDGRHHEAGGQEVRHRHPVDDVLEQEERRAPDGGDDEQPDDGQGGGGGRARDGSGSPCQHTRRRLARMRP